MEFLTGRIKSHIASRRALPADTVNAESLQMFWAKLSKRERLAVLRFEDAALVQQLESHMKALCLKELWSSQSSGSSRSERLKGFSFERSRREIDCMGTQKGPVAFCAMPEFVQCDNILEKLKEELGSDFLSGRPAYARGDWILVVYQKPDSWHELQMQVLRLVELALLYAEQEDCQNATGVSLEAALIAQMEAEEEEVHKASSSPKAFSSQTTKPRARKKKGRVDSATDSCHSQHVDTDAAEQPSEFFPEGDEQMASETAGSSCTDSETAGSSCTEGSSAPPCTASNSDTMEVLHRASSSWSAWIGSSLKTLIGAAPVVKVDRAIIRDFWRRLSLEERLSVLRYEDGTLVQRVHGHVNTLCRADIWARMQGARNAADTDDTEDERLVGFGFECPSELSCMGERQPPTAFCAFPEFVQNDNLLDEIEEYLGSAFLDGRPALPRKEWSSVVKTAPSSWKELRLQVLKLVELALLDAQQDTRRFGRILVDLEGEIKARSQASYSAQTSNDLQSSEVQMLEGIQTGPAAAGLSKKSRGRRKKKQAAGSLQAQAGPDCQAPSDNELAIDVNTDVPSDNELPTMSSPDCQAPSDVQTEEHDLPDGTFGEEAAVERMSTVDTTSTTDTANVQLTQVQRRGDAPEETHGKPHNAWSSWIPSTLMDEFEWAFFQPAWFGAGTRVIVKNTFVDIKVDAEKDRKPRRRRVSRSCNF
jgi:hypothetical protein